jgi:prepilin-type N-terminal cleavage/methylation domain-containing protein
MGIVLPIRDQNKRGFTLVELLAVILIMGMLMLIAIPSFQSANRGGRTRTATLQLNSAVSLARQTAITTRQNVHIVFPDSGLTYDESTVDLAYRSYAIYGARDGYMGEWRRLPEGVIFDNAFRPPSETGTGSRNVFRQTGSGDFVDISFPDDESTSLQRLLALTYRPDGTLNTGINLRAAYITHGWVDLEAVGGGVDAVQVVPGSTVYGVEIRPESGQTRMREYNP